MKIRNAVLVCAAALAAAAASAAVDPLEATSPKAYTNGKTLRVSWHLLDCTQKGEFEVPAG